MLGVYRFWIFVAADNKKVELRDWDRVCRVRGDSYIARSMCLRPQTQPGGERFWKVDCVLFGITVVSCCFRLMGHSSRCTCSASLSMCGDGRISLKAMNWPLKIKRFLWKSSSHSSPDISLEMAYLSCSPLLPLAPFNSTSFLNSNSNSNSNPLHPTHQRSPPRMSSSRIPESNPYPLPQEALLI